jgi:hypothetical protein
MSPKRRKRFSPHPIFAILIESQRIPRPFMALWCNWLTRRPLKAKSPGSSPGNATKNLNKINSLKANSESRSFAFFVLVALWWHFCISNFPISEHSVYAVLIGSSPVPELKVVQKKSYVHFIRPVHAPVVRKSSMTGCHKLEHVQTSSGGWDSENMQKVLALRSVSKFQ